MLRRRSEAERLRYFIKQATLELERDHPLQALVILRFALETQSASSDDGDFFLNSSRG
jgi:hypothetical protein